MVSEVIDYLQVEADNWYVDATFGRGGHTRAILEQGGYVIAFDVDQEAIEYGRQAFAQDIQAQKLVLIRSNFSHLEAEINKFQSHQAEAAAITGILFDFGTSLDQIRAPHRGFSFDEPDAPLDMRMDQDLGVTASDLLTVLSVKQLIALFKDYGGEIHAKKIAQAIDKYRKPDRSRKIETVGQLVKIVTETVQRKSHLHPATKVFQALRIVVNDELNSIEQALPQALNILENQGRIITIAFHEGEDRLVKHQFKAWTETGQGQILTPKPIQPKPSEINNNPSARSAKLRAFCKQQ